MKFQYFFPILLALSFFHFDLYSQCQKQGENGACCSQEKCSSAHIHSVAPIGVMSDHCHPKGGLMLSYRFMPMQMAGNRSGTSTIEDAAIFDNYMLAPQEMNMQMHMLGIMYGLTDRLTLMGMANYQQNKMTMLTMDDRSHTHESAGFGDFRLSVVSSLWQSQKQNLHAHLGISFPTGSINLTEVNHFAHHHGHEGNMESPMPYPMRLGSGSYDLFLGATYALQFQQFSVGAQVQGKLRTADNQRNYRLGNQADLQAWFGYQVANWLNLNVGGQGRFTQKISGLDQELMAMLSPTNDIANSGGTRFYSTLGFNLLIPKCWKGLQVGGEFGLPVYQKVNGIQMEQDYFFTLGLKLNLI